MTKKDYELVADTISDLLDKAREGTDMNRHFRQVARKLAAAFAEDNPKFDSNKFLKACEPHQYIKSNQDRMNAAGK